MKITKMYYAIIIVIMVTIMEIFLRLFWNNYYLSRGYQVEAVNKDGYYRLWGDTRQKFMTKGLYPDSGLVDFNIINHCQSGVNSKTKSMFIGGSTTENMFIPLAERFPYKFSKGSLNCAYSGTTLLDSLYSYTFLVEKYKDYSIDNLYVMHAINDASSFFKTRDANVIKDLKILKQYHKNDKNLMTSFFKNFYISAFIVAMSQRDNSQYQLYLKEKNLQTKEILSDKEFKNLVSSDEFNLFMNGRRGTLDALKNKTLNNNTNLVLMTQPHSYVSNFTPFKDDLRMYFLYGSKRMSLDQSEKIMKIINTQTLSYSRKNNVKVIDLNRCFANSGLDYGLLFYDSVHLNKRGNDLVSRCMKNEK